jgi:2-C-methyl-D-erythritol 4-phosphate cytidylyltransferase
MTADRPSRSSSLTAAVVAAGGLGRRMKRRRPKQYLHVEGAPLLVHTLRALLASGRVHLLVVAVPDPWQATTRRLLQRHGLSSVVDVVAGGAERQESVWRALQAVPERTRWVLVHDAVRPFITRELIGRVLAAARRHGAAICALPVRETVKRVEGHTVAATLDREGLWLVQTPQVFRRTLLWEAHEKARRDGFVGTDDAVLVERAGGRVDVVLGLRGNIKLTTPEDLGLARLRLARSERLTR